MQTAIGAVCANISPKERRMRMTIGIIGAIATLGALAAVVVMRTPLWVHALIMLPASVSAAGFFQAYAHTCVQFAAQDIKVLGDSRKDAVKVTADEKAQIAKQARAVYRNIILATLAVGAVALLVWKPPFRAHQPPNSVTAGRV